MAFRPLILRASTHFLTCALLLAPAALNAAELPGQVASPVRPLQAEIVGPLDISRVKQGTRVLAQVVEDWKYADCHLRPGAMIQGHVVQFSLRTKTVKDSSIQVLFDKADCNNHPSSEFNLTLIALIGSYGDPPPAGESGMALGPPLADAPGLSIGVNSAPAGHADASMRGASTASAVNEYTQTVHKTRNLPSQILPGQVIDVPHTSLKIAAGIDGTTIITALNHDARIEPRSTLIMIPSSAYQVVKRSVADALHKTTTASAPPESLLAPKSAAPTTIATAQPEAPAEEADETEICSGTCNILGSMASRTAGTSAIAASLPIDKLGYAPHGKEYNTTFNNETTLTYLDETHLLCTFDPHRLRSRTNDLNTDPVRSIRAVLIDTSTHSVTRVMEWRVRGADTYLWRLGKGQILVHLVHSLQLYDSELHPLQTIPVDGPIAWVVSSPSNDHLAVAIARKRYSGDVESQLHAWSLVPDEDFEVLVYDSNYKLISASIRSSRTLQPVLSDAGELRTVHIKYGRWKIVEYGWDNTERDIATVKSICRPLLSVPETGLTFVTGCMATSGGIWYRMLRSDGHPLLKGESPSDEVAQSAEAAVAGSFAVRIFKSARPLSVDDRFNRSDLTREEIAIYRSSDGSRLSSIATDDFILSEDSYALSPAGDQMALAGKDSILFYNVKAR
jgi:hypothetical protein